jgi:Plasmid stabilization system protein
MARKVVWTKRANQKFNKIIEYLEAEWGENVTRNFVKRTFEVIELMSDQPEIGTKENPEKQIRGFLLTKHNRLFYRTTEKELKILNFFDTRSKPRKTKIQ